MDRYNEDYWYNKWQFDHELHFKLGVKDVTPIDRSKDHVSIYADTDSLFVSFKPAIDHCKWKDLLLNTEYLNSIESKFVIFSREIPKFNNPNCVGISKNIEEFKSLIGGEFDLILVDGYFIKNRGYGNLLKDLSQFEIRYNWSHEVDFIHGIDYFRYGGYFKKCLEDYAETFGVENKEDFELERISESIINLSKKKYIQNIVYEDGIPFDRLSYIYPKGVELVRSSTPAFAREKIVHIVKYLFSNPDTFNIKELLKLVKGLRKEFELADIDDIAMQSSCSNYETKVLNDKSLPLQFVNGSHFAVKASAMHNYLLHKNPEYQSKYEFIKSGTKIKYYCCKDTGTNDMFAYIRGSFPIEFAPIVDYDLQFMKSILSPINSIIEPLGMPQITSRLSIVMDIFGGSGGF